MIRGLVAAAVLCARLAHAAPLLLDPFDTITDTANTTADDCADWIEDRHGSSPDADIRPVTSPVHDDASGGSSTSKHALQAVVSTTGRWVRYTRAVDFKPASCTAAGVPFSCCTGNGTGCSLGTLTAGFSWQIGSGEQPSGGRRTGACLLETDEADGGSADPRTDPGCCAVADTDRTLWVVYLGSNEGSCTPDGDDADCDADEVCMGSVCRKFWVHSAEKLEVNACSSDKTIPCTSAGQCPATLAVPSPACDQVYWGGVELGQTTVSAGSVICRMRLNGRVVTDAAIETPIAGSPVNNVVNVALGVLDYGQTAGTATFRFDDFVPDPTTRAGYGYVGTQTPSAIGATSQWTTDSSCAGAQFTCVRDWGVSPYTFDSGLTSNEAMRVKKPDLTQDFPRLQTGGTITLGPNQAVTAVEAVTILRGSGAGSLASERPITQSILVCDTAAGTSCGTAAACCETESPTYEIPADTNLGIYRYLATTSPKPGFSSWSSVLGFLGLRLQTQPTYSSSTPARISYAGATAAYVRVLKPDRRERRTFREGNKGTDDGIFTCADDGDSTAKGVAQLQCLGGVNKDQACTQNSYCEWDSFDNGGFQDLPSGGCLGANGTYEAGDDANCSRCLVGNPQDYRACPSGTCNFGTCGAEIANRCENDQTIVCSVDADCTGTCDTTQPCVESCPGSECPQGAAGWPATLAPKIDCDVHLNCGLGGEDSGQNLKYRFDAILDGIGSVLQTNGMLAGAVAGTCWPGEPGCTGCEAIVGSGVCTCDSHSDCGPSGTCSCTTANCGGTCTAAPNDPLRLACTSGTQCEWPDGKYCQFPKPDLVNVLLSYNDQAMYPYGQAGVFGAQVFDAECETINSLRSITGGQQVKHCPGVGTGAYQAPALACQTPNDCSANSALSRCFGQCSTGQRLPCTTDAWCNGNPGACSVNMPPCDTNSECPNGGTCVGGNPDAPGASPTGYCGCTSNANCSNNFVCIKDGVGAVGICRKPCTTTDECNPGSSGQCDTTTCGATTGGSTCDTNNTGFCIGSCTTPCGAISCSDDGACGGTLEDRRWGGLRSAYYRGKCNKAAGKCTCCGSFTCSDHEPLLARGCSCASSGDCPSGTCVNNECVGGTKGSCQSDEQCPGFQCLRCNDQILTYARTHEDLYPQVATLMKARIDALPETDGRPALVISSPPMTGGMVGDGSIVPDTACQPAFSDRTYLARMREKLLSVLPARYVVDQSPFNNARFSLPYHREIVHWLVAGATPVGQAVGDTDNALNVCVTGAGAPQRYCQNLNGSFPNRCTCTSPTNGINTTDCGTGGFCTNGFCTAGASDKVECATPNVQSTCASSQTCSPAPICTIDTDCPSDEVCARRRCDACTSNGDCGTGGVCTNGICLAGTTIWRDANCPAATDTCNPW